MNYETIRVTLRDQVCRIAFDRPDVGHAINARMIEELTEVLEHCSRASGPEGQPITVVVIEGGEEVFCAGGDFDAVAETGTAGDPAPLYDLWLKLAEGPYVTISLVKGRVNAGGVGFVAASDIVIAQEQASFALSELLFGIFPALVLPFLIQRIGRRNAHKMTLMTRPILAADALGNGLVDQVVDDVEVALRSHLMRLRYLRKTAISRYKAYLAVCGDDLHANRSHALSANRAMFSDPEVIAGIRRYVDELKFPWEE